MRVEINLSNEQRATQRAEEIERIEKYGDMPLDEILEKEETEKEEREAREKENRPRMSKRHGKYKHTHNNYGDQIAAIDKETKICK